MPSGRQRLCHSFRFSSPFSAGVFSFAGFASGMIAALVVLFLLTYFSFPVYARFSAADARFSLPSPLPHAAPFSLIFFLSFMLIRRHVIDAFRRHAAVSDSRYLFSIPFSAAFAFSILTIRFAGFLLSPL